MHWNLNPSIDAKAFAYVPSAGVTKIPFHTSLAASGGDK
jgi:hypothetical protein